MALKGKYMSVETGSAGGVGFVGGAVEAGGFSAHGIGIGAEITALSAPIVNEGPVGAGFRLEDTMPYIIGTSNPIEQIVVEPSAPLVIREAESIAAAAWEPLIVNEVIEEANHWLGITEPNVEQISQEIATLPSVARNDACNESIVKLLISFSIKVKSLFFKCLAILARFLDGV